MNENLKNNLENDLESKIAYLCSQAKSSAHDLAVKNFNKRNEFLAVLSENLMEAENVVKIITENQKDLNNARGIISDVMLDRLKLDENRIKNIANSIKKIISLADPLNSGQVFERANGLIIRKISVPIGVVAMIYESRPNVTVDVAALCIKSGNCAVLRGGKEAIYTNLILIEIIKSALKQCDFSEHCVEFISDTSRESANILMQQRDFIDLLIPRGNASLIQNVRENAKIPVIETGVGNCHIFVDESADFNTAAKIILESKRRASVCNSIETVLIHANIYREFLPIMRDFLNQLCENTEDFEIRGCEKTYEILKCKIASEEDYFKEFNDYILSVRVVENLENAISHINKYSSKHSECILTQNLKNAREFQKNVDSACVYANVSTRFTDGEEFGFGAEIGIATSKLHVRGPFGLEGLTSVKYLIDGDNLVR